MNGEVGERPTRGREKRLSLILAFVFGVVFVSVLLAIAILLPEPTPTQFFVFRVVLALAASGVAAVIPGLLNVEVAPFPKTAIRAGGALGIFVIVYFFSPAGMVVSQEPASDILMQSVEAGSAGRGHTVIVQFDIVDPNPSAKGHVEISRQANMQSSEQFQIPDLKGGTMTFSPNTGAGQAWVRIVLRAGDRTLTSSIREVSLP
ncbi:MAG: hypothetical protein AAF517_02910 [Planctomycetota bacterium]